jgi:hypothetical protein
VHHISHERSCVGPGLNSWPDVTKGSGIENARHGLITLFLKASASRKPQPHLHVSFLVTSVVMANNGNTTVLPFVYPPSGHWDGVDGRWSTFNVSVGTPAQHFRVVPATNGQNLFIPLPEACKPQDPSSCPDTRGMGDGTGFAQNESSTWKVIGFYPVRNDEHNSLNISGTAVFGFDAVNISGLSLNATDTPVGGFSTQKQWLGLLPLDVRPIVFGDSKWYPSFIHKLFNASKIPSVSYSYTAGAYYSRLAVI